MVYLPIIVSDITHDALLVHCVPFVLRLRQKDCMSNAVRVVHVEKSMHISSTSLWYDSIDINLYSQLSCVYD